MSYAPAQPPSGSNTNLVLITLGVCVASFLELFLCVVCYFLLAGGLFATKMAMLYRQQPAQANQPPAIRQPKTPVPSSSLSRSSTTSGPGTAYSSMGQVNVNDRVHILWGSNWWPGTVIQKQGSRAKIHYDNHADSWDELVGLDRLRRMSPSDPKYRATSSSTSSIPSQPASSVASRSASTANLNPRGLSAPFNSSLPPQDSSNRDWKNRSGEVVFQGHLYANYGAAIRLARGDGQGSNSIPVDLSLLSDDDQAYVRRFPQVATDRTKEASSTASRIAAARAENARRAQEMRERAQQQQSPPKPAATPTPMPAPAAPALDQISGMRTWTDSTGIYKMDGELIGVVNGNIQLKRPDGKVSIMPLNKLSAEDRALVLAKYPQ